MDFIIEEHRIYANGETGLVEAEILFPALDQNTVNITKTYVSPNLRGQGVAGKLMQMLVARLRQNGLTCVPTCSYAIDWFAKHPEGQDLLAQNRVQG